MIIDKSSKLITNNWLLIIILILAAVLRLWHLATIPPHLTPDEASLGYNAYSILKTGKDEYGELLPIIFKSFGDFKPGLYIYLTTPFIAIFGLNEFAVRLPSAISGVIAVWLIYLVANELFKKQKKYSIGLAASFLLAINPWHIYFSRGAWEVNVALTLTLAGAYFFFRALKKNKYLIISTVLFALSYVTYQGAKLATTIPIILLVVFYFRDLVKIDRKILAISIIAGLIISSSIIFSFVGGKTGRLEVFSVFSYGRPNEELELFLKQGEERVGSLNYYILHSEKLNFTRGVLGRFFNHFSGRFLIFTGDWQNPRHSAPNHGMLLTGDLIFLFIGIFSLIRKKEKSSWFVLLWLILATLPAILSRDQVHAVRALFMVIPLTIVSAMGFYTLLIYIKSFKKLKIAGYLIVVGVLVVSFIYFLDAYFVHMPVKNAKHWFYGYKQVVEELAQIQDNYDSIVFQQSYSQPYIYFLFYQKYPPVKYQSQAKLKDGGIDVGLVEKFDNFRFEFFSWPVRSDENILIVGNSEIIPGDFSREDYKLISEIKYPNGIETAFRIIEIQ